MKVRVPFLVKHADSMAEGVRFLKFRTTFAADRTFYTEGVLFAPAGSRLAAEKTSVAPDGTRWTPEKRRL